MKGDNIKTNYTIKKSGRSMVGDYLILCANVRFRIFKKYIFVLISVRKLEGERETSGMKANH